MRKYIYLIILLFFCFGFSSPHHKIIARKNAGGGEVSQEAGYSTLGGTPASTANDRCQKFTTDGAMTVTHAYLYGFYNSTGNDLAFAVYDDDTGSPGSVVGGCSDGGDMAQSATPIWYERTWSSNNPSLSASTTYWICRYTDSGLTEYYDDGDAGTSFYDAVAEGGCPADCTQTSTRQTTMTVSNYDVR